MSLVRKKCLENEADLICETDSKFIRLRGAKFFLEYEAC